MGQRVNSHPEKTDKYGAFILNYNLSIRLNRFMVRNVRHGSSTSEDLMVRELRLRISMSMNFRAGPHYDILHLRALLYQRELPC